MDLKVPGSIPVSGIYFLISIFFIYPYLFFLNDQTYFYLLLGQFCYTYFIVKIMLKLIIYKDKEKKIIWPRIWTWDQQFLRLLPYPLDHEGCKVWIIWEGHKIWKNLPLKIWRYWVASNFKWKIFSNFVAFSEYPNFTKNCRKTFYILNIKGDKSITPHALLV